LPSRLHPGQVYALRQAPQQFKQLLMVSGFERYFQIAPCFRDEDARADRSPGEFYQLDLEMAFVTQEDIFAVVEDLFSRIFAGFSSWQTTAIPFPGITYKEATHRYSTDKPDLRFGREIEDVSIIFPQSEFRLFFKTVENGGGGGALFLENCARKPRSFFSALKQFIQDKGGKGLAYLNFSPEGAQGPIAAVLEEETIAKLRHKTEAREGSSLLFVADEEGRDSALMGQLRLHLADVTELREKRSYRFCWVVDFLMYEWDAERQAIAFSHNPFPMPQGGLEAL
jgi:aspartyl-tRNA synthetase